MATRQKSLADKKPIDQPSTNPQPCINYMAIYQKPKIPKIKDSKPNIVKTKDPKSLSKNQVTTHQSNPNNQLTQRRDKIISVKWIIPSKNGGNNYDDHMSYLVQKAVGLLKEYKYKQVDDIMINLDDEMVFVVFVTIFELYCNGTDNDIVSAKNIIEYYGVPSLELVINFQNSVDNFAKMFEFSQLSLYDNEHQFINDIAAKLIEKLENKKNPNTITLVDDFINYFKDQLS